VAAGMQVNRRTGSGRVVGNSYLRITSGLPVIRQVGNPLRHNSSLGSFSRVIAFLLLLDESLGDASSRARAREFGWPVQQINQSLRDREAL